MDNFQIDKDLKKTVTITVAVSLLVMILTLAMPFNMLMMFMWVIPSESISSIYTIVIVSLGALLFMVVFDVLRFALLRRFSLYLNETLGERILLGMFRDRAHQRKSEFQSAMGDLNRVRNFLQSHLSTAFLDAIISPLQLAIVFYLSPIMGVLTLVCMLIMLSTRFFGRKSARELLRSANRRFGSSNAFAQECVYNAQSAQAMGMLPQLSAKWRRMQDAMVMEQTEASEKAGVRGAISKSMGWIMQVLLMGTGFGLILTVHMDPGYMIVAVIIAGRIVMPMQMVVNGWDEYQNTRDAYERLRVFLAELAEKEGKPVVNLPRPQGRLKAESLVYGDSGKPIIKGISFDLEPGEAMGVIGASGAGKTTLARVLTGVSRPQNGILRLDGSDMHQWDQDRLGQYIGYLPQEVELFAGTIFDNIARFQDADPVTLQAAARLAGIDDLIMELPAGYDTLLDERGQNLAGGFRQRIGLARALFGDVRLLILDEPDANLDQAGMQALQQVMAHARQEKITVVLVSHSQQLLLMTDKLLMLRSGQVSLYGPSQQVLQKLIGPAA